MTLAVSNLTVGYGQSSIVKQVNLEFEPGRVYGLIGPNGCGKSTLLKTLAQLQPALAGEIHIDHHNLAQMSSRERARKIAMLCQHNPTPEGITVEQLVAFGRTPHRHLWQSSTTADNEAIQRALALGQLEDLRERPLADLSGGQRQRAWLAMTLAQESHYLLLDEPTTYLDLNHQVALMTLTRRLKAESRTSICVLHDLNQACRYCDELVVVGQGRIVATGQPDTVITPELLRSVFSVNASISRDPVSDTPLISLHDDPV